jgi:hypothetical protein
MHSCYSRSILPIVIRHGHTPRQGACFLAGQLVTVTTRLGHNDSNCYCNLAVSTSVFGFARIHGNVVVVVVVVGLQVCRLSCGQLHNIGMVGQSMRSLTQPAFSCFSLSDFRLEFLGVVAIHIWRAHALPLSRVISSWHAHAQRLYPVITRLQWQIAPRRRRRRRRLPYSFVKPLTYYLLLFIWTEESSLPLSCSCRL